MKLLNLAKRGQTIEQIVSLLRAGEVIAIPTDTCFGLAACAKDETAVKEVFRIKERDPEEPVAIILSAMDEIRAVARIDNETYELIASMLDFSSRFTFILNAKRNVPFPSPYIVKRQKVGVRLPEHPLPRKIVGMLGTPITATSANKSGNPPLYDYKALKNVDIRYVVKATLPKRPPSTVVDLTSRAPELLRVAAVSREKVKNLLKGFRR